MSEDDLFSINIRLEISFSGAILKLYFSVIWVPQIHFFEKHYHNQERCKIGNKTVLII